MSIISHARITKEIISSIPVLQYDPSWSGTGVSKELKVGDRRVLGSDTHSYCSGAVYEFLWNLLEKYGKIESIGYSNMRELQRYAYVRTDLDAKYQQGLPKGLVDLGMGKFVGVEDVNEGGFFFGQLFDKEDDTGKTVLGHAVVCLKQTQNSRGAPALWTFSSAPEGIGGGKTEEDYWSYHNGRTGRSRTWYVAQLNDSFLLGG